jgi:prefoldin alpha subunit
MDNNVIERAHLLSQESEMLKERGEFIDEQIQELAVFGSDLGILKNSESSEILASIGKGLYLKSNVTEKTFFVNVGAGILVKKSMDESKKVIDGQISKLGSMREKINSRLISVVTELRALRTALEKEKSI